MTEFGGPSSVESIDWKTLFGKLLAIWPYGREMVVTRFGEKAAIRADVYDLDSGVPVSMDALIFPRALVMQLGSTVRGRAVVGRLAQGESRNAQTPPWKLMDPTPEDLARASAYFSANPPRVRQQMSSAAPVATSAQTPAQPAAPVGYSQQQYQPLPQASYPQPPANEQRPPF